MTTQKTEYPHAGQYRAISNRAFTLFLKDMDTLRSMYRRCQIDIPTTMIARLPRDKIINALLAVEFGVDAVIEYVSTCRAWDKDKAFVEA